MQYLLLWILLQGRRIGLSFQYSSLWAVLIFKVSVSTHMRMDRRPNRLKIIQPSTQTLFWHVGKERFRDEPKEAIKPDAGERNELTAGADHKIPTVPCSRRSRAFRAVLKRQEVKRATDRARERRRFLLLSSLENLVIMTTEKPDVIYSSPKKTKFEQLRADHELFLQAFESESGIFPIRGRQRVYFTRLVFN